MKKIISSMILALILGTLCFGLVSCGSNEVEYGPYNIGVVYGGETEAAKEATVSFITNLQSSIGSDKLTIYILAETQEMADALKNDSGNKDNSKVTVYASADLKAGVNDWLISEEHDLDLIGATTNKAVEACKVNVKSIPVVANAVAYANEERNTSMGSDGSEQIETIKIPSSMGIAPSDVQISYIEELSANSNKNISFVYDHANLDSIAQVNALVKELEVKGYTCSRFDTASINDAFVNDIVYVVEDANTLAAAEAIKALNTDIKTVIASSEALYEACADTAITINYSMVGTNAADIAFDILVNSKTYAQAKEIADKYVSIARKKSK